MEYRVIARKVVKARGTYECSQRREGCSRWIATGDFYVSVTVLIPELRRTPGGPFHRVAVCLICNRSDLAEYGESVIDVERPIRDVKTDKV